MSSKVSPSPESSLLNNFESSLTERLKKLIPQNRNEILTLPWMILAMESLCETHSDIHTLITDLKLHEDRKYQYWVDVYVDITAKMFDLCNEFSSKLNLINRGVFALKCLRHNLETICGEKQCVEIRSTFDHWKKNINADNTEFGKILDGFVESLNFPQEEKNDLNADLFKEAFYAASVLMVYISSVFATVLSNCDKNLMRKSVPKKGSLWEKAFSDLQNRVNAKIDVLSSGGTMLPKELECVDAKVRKIYLEIQDGEKSKNLEFKDSIMELTKEVDILDHGLAELSVKVHNLFCVTLKERGTIHNLL